MRAWRDPQIMNICFFNENLKKSNLFNRIRAFRRAKILGNIDCGFAALWFVSLLCFLASWACGLTVFDKKP